MKSVLSVVSKESLENSNKSYISNKALVLVIICNKCSINIYIVFKKKEYTEPLKVLWVLINNNNG